jgi:hypothetical protein
MNVERTMQFILEQQVAASASLARMGKRRFAEIDKRLSATAKLLQIGMKALVETDAILKETTASTKRANSPRRGKNGRSR